MFSHFSWLPQFAFSLKDFVWVYRNLILLDSDLFLDRTKKWLAKELEQYKRVVQSMIGVEKSLLHCTIFLKLLNNFNAK